MKSTRVGLSEYTAKRLAELRARRAEAEETGGYLTSSTTSAVSATEYHSASSLLANGCSQHPVSDSLHMDSTTVIETGASEYRDDTNSGLPSDVSRTTFHSDAFTSDDSNAAAQLRESFSFRSSEKPVQLFNQTSAETKQSDNNVVPMVDDYTHNGSLMADDAGSLHHNLANGSMPLMSTSSEFDKIHHDGNGLMSKSLYTCDNTSSTIPLASEKLLYLSSSELSRHDKSPRPAVAAKPSLKALGLSSSSSLTRRVSESSSVASDLDYIGFGCLPEQVHRKAAKKGFDFTVMVVGETGLGKSTVIKNLFNNYDLYNDRPEPDLLTVDKTVEIEKRAVEIEDRGIKVRLTIVDTPGFGDAVNSNNCWDVISSYIEQQFEQYYKAETGLNRQHIKDSRVNCCLYFISPYGRGLRPMDVYCMQQLQQKVNIVPVIAKADTLTPTETVQLKASLLQELKKHNIRVYEMPPCDDDDDDYYKERDREMKDAWPFAVIGANSVVEVGGRKIRGRVYPWGLVEADNPRHSDFIRLQQFLISTHLHDLKDVTSDVHYESFRVNRLHHQQQTSDVLGSKRSVGNVVEADSETEALLRQKEDEIHRMQLLMQQMQAQLTETSRTQMNF